MFNSLNRKQLQSLAKRHGIRANMSSAKLKKELMKVDFDPEESESPVAKRSRSDLTPTTTSENASGGANSAAAADAAVVPLVATPAKSETVAEDEAPISARPVPTPLSTHLELAASMQSEIVALEEASAVEDSELGQLTRRYEELLTLRETEPETLRREAYAELAKQRIALVEAHALALAQERERSAALEATLRAEIDALRLAAAPLVEEEEEDELAEAMEEEEEEEEAASDDGDELPTIVAAYRMLTGTRVEIASEPNCVVCTAINPATRRVVRFELAVEAGRVEFAPTANAALLPEYLRDGVVAEEHDAPALLAAVIEALGEGEEAEEEEEEEVTAAVVPEAEVEAGAEA